MSIIRTVGQYTPPQSPDEIPTGVGYVPVGSIISWIPGYFSSLNNIGYNRSFGTADTVAAANTYLLPLGWRVCDGGEPNDAVSPIWSSSGKKVPQLHDKRFLQGSLSIVASGEGSLDPDGTIQGASNTIPDHTHGLGTISMSNVDISHSHSVGTLVNAAEGDHIHAAGTYSTNCSLSNNAVAANTHTHIAPAHYHGIGTGTGLSAAGQTLGSTLVSLASGASSVIGNKSQLSHGHSTRTNNLNTGGGDRMLQFTTTGFSSSFSDTTFTHVNDITFAGTFAASGSASGTIDIGHTHPNPSTVTGTIGLFAGGVDGNSTTAMVTTTNSASTTVSLTNTTLSNRSGRVVDAVGVNATHNHTISGSVATSTGVGQTAHTHSLSGSVGYGNAPSATDNRPQYLRCFMIIRIK